LTSPKGDRLGIPGVLGFFNFFLFLRKPLTKAKEAKKEQNINSIAIIIENFKKIY
jgi:hypothetical protein